MNGLGLFLVGVGAGLAGGAMAGPGALTAAAVPVLVGMALLILKGRSEPEGTRPGPVLSGLGTRVHDILRLAEDQAADHVAEARRQADRIVADARAKARRIHPE
ncbi:hypothetical protein [Actinoplanes sp. NPDC049802]|uniref:hypothetical protein n=1 Tax=Actinoplanes sp. NPDC049802 TaxID=3154742 RepID=UPI0033F40EE4